MKKLYISADIEGTTGIANWDETIKNRPDYAYFAGEMTDEVSAVCEGADSVGWTSTVRDGHDSARNIIPDRLFEGARLIRGWIREGNVMMGGLSYEHYDAVAFTGYHSGAFTGGNVLAHTESAGYERVLLNGELCSEFILNSYAAAALGIPVVFLSGDAALCESAKKLIPEICTVITKEDHDSGAISRHPKIVRNEMREVIKEALKPEHLTACHVTLPDHFAIEIMYQDAHTAYKNSNYPGAKLVNACSVLYETDDIKELQRACLFIL